MVLTETQAKLFYDLWIPLLDYVNQKYKLRKDFYGMDSPKGLPLDVVKIIIHDGIVMPYRVCFGKNMADQARQMYLNAKEHKRIIECM